MPNWAAGPEKAADWPSRIDLAVTPGVCAKVSSGTMLASRQAIRNLVFMANPLFVRTLATSLLRQAGGTKLLQASFCNRSFNCGGSRDFVRGRLVRLRRCQSHNDRFHRSVGVRLRLGRERRKNKQETNPYKKRCTQDQNSSYSAHHVSPRPGCFACCPR